MTNLNTILYKPHSPEEEYGFYLEQMKVFRAKVDSYKDKPLPYEWTRPPIQVVLTFAEWLECPIHWDPCYMTFDQFDHDLEYEADCNQGLE
jgi:hypothetical protein